MHTARIAVAALAAVASTAVAVLVGVPAGVAPATAAPAVRASSTGVTSPAAPETSLAPQVEVVGGSDEARAAVGQAVDRFVAARMALPDLRVAIHDDDAACRGHLGRFTTAATPWQVHLCSELEFVPTHELAHAWVAAHVPRSHHDTIVEATGAAAWGGDVAWRERGIERAAITIQQVLMAPRTRMTEHWADLIADFEVVTGMGVPDPGRWDPPASAAGDR